MGPTASGKTDLSLQLASEFDSEIISVDSAMVYRGMDIGTAKPSLVELSRVTHHLIDILNPNEIYSAANFQRDALSAITSIQAKGKLPILVGGTMLYFKVLQTGLSLLPSASESLRDQINRQAATLGWQAMHQRLQTVDPIAAARISPADTQRIQRALEVYELTNKPLSSLWQLQQEECLPTLEFINVALAPSDRGVLHAKIADRFAMMLQAGLLEEVSELVRKFDLNLDLPSLRAVGYRQAYLFLRGEIKREELSDKGVAATRQLAKRQLTWLRSWPELVWFDSCEPKVYRSLVEHVSQLTSS
jgi:tRNA dimethylallyltransferase